MSAGLLVFLTSLPVEAKRTIVSIRLAITITLILAPLLFMQCNPNKADEHKLKPGEPVLIGPSDENSSFSYYNTSPESPDGSKIAYVRFLDKPVQDRSEKVPGELWVCNADLSSHRKIIDLRGLVVHNGASAQWVDDHSIAYQDDSIRVVNLQGQELMPAVEGRIGHAAHGGKLLFSAQAASGLSTIYEYEVMPQRIAAIADVMDLKGLTDHFSSEDFLEVADWRILHLQYSPDGTKIAFRVDVGPPHEAFKHLVSMDVSGGDIRFFGPKPMHFYWYDNASFMGHDNQVNDGMPDDKSLRRWDRDGNFIETLAGPGNHTGAAPDRHFFASESWYQEIPVILSAFKKGQTEPFWQDTVSQDKHTTWELAYHTNPAFSRDGSRIYYIKCIAPGRVHTFVAVLPEGQK